MRWLKTVILFLPLAGCANLPLPVAEFADVEAFTKASKREMPFGPVASYGDVRVAFLAYYNLYLDEANKKRDLAQKASETGFYAAAIGVLGGIGKSIEVAAGGAVVSAGAGLYGDRYRLGVQAHNYELGAASLLCMYQLLPGKTDDTLKNYVFKDTQRPANEEIRDIALSGLLVVRDKMRSLQTSFDFGQADPAKLKAALAAPKSDASANTKSIMFAFVKDQPVPPDVENYSKDIKTCEALMGA